MRPHLHLVLRRHQCTLHYPVDCGGVRQCLRQGRRGSGREEGSPFFWALCTCKLLQLCLTLCDPMDCSPPGSSVHGILQARMLEWVAISSSKGSSRPRDQARSPALASGFSATEALGKPLDHSTKDIAEVRVLVTQ